MKLHRIKYVHDETGAQHVSHFLDIGMKKECTEILESKGFRIADWFEFTIFDEVSLERVADQADKSITEAKNGIKGFSNFV